MGSESARNQRCHSSRSAPAMSNYSLLVLASILAISSHRHQQDAKSIVGISGIGVASAFDIRRSSPSKISPKSTLTDPKALFFADDEGGDSSSSSSSNDGGSGSGFFFMNDCGDNPPSTTRTSSAGVSSGINGFHPRPPSVPPPPRLFRMHNATPSSSTSTTHTAGTMFERKAVVLSSTVSGNDPSTSNGGGYPATGTSAANQVDAVVDTISDALDQARQAGGRFWDGLDVNVPNFGGSIREIAHDNANVVQPFLRMMGNAASKAAEIVVRAYIFYWHLMAE